MAKTPQTRTWSLPTQSDGRRWSHPAQFVGVPTPAQPTLVSATASSVTINATNPGGTAATMHVYRDGVRVTGGNGVPFGNYTLTGLTASTNYSVRVTAVNAQGVESAQSAARSVTTAFAGGEVAHGQPFSVTGAGFGAKAADYQNPHTAPIAWDDFSGSDLSQWDDRYPFGNTNPADDMARRANGFRGVSSPNLRSGGFAAGGLVTPVSGASLYSVGLGKFFTRPTPDLGTAPFIHYARWYERVDANWDNTSSDGNFKTYGWGKSWYSLPENWYSGPAAPSIDPANFAFSLNDDAGFGSSASAVRINASGAYAANPILAARVADRSSANLFNWALVEVWYYCTNDSTGRVRVELNRSPQIDVFTGKTHPSDSTSAITVVRTLDNYDTANDRRHVMAGGFVRAYSTGGNLKPNNFRYFADVYMDVGEGWFYLTNSADWATSTIREVQPYTAWTDTAVTLTCNGGQLPSGAVHLHFRRAPWQATGHQYLGTRVLA